jgi:hypothetical protein
LVEAKSSWVGTGLIIWLMKEEDGRGRTNTAVTNMKAKLRNK